MTAENPNRIVWAEIPVSDMARAKAFYEAVLKEPLKDDDTGPNPMAMLPYPGGAGVSGQIYPGTPAKNGEGPTVHLAASGELSDAMARVKDVGDHLSAG
ncbi:MAG: VOC family protein, partial [Pseudomonadota bacterium]